MSPNRPLPPELRRLIDDCFLHDRDRLRHDEALEILRERVRPVVAPQSVSLSHAAGRILAAPVTAPRDIPSANNSAVDGYAFALTDYEVTGGFFPVDARITAGHPSGKTVMPGRAVRIFTGAVMPEGTDTVAMQEDCELHEQDGQSFVVIPPGLRSGANCRLAGEDVKTGAAMLDAGCRLRPQELAAIASTGLPHVTVAAPLKVALVSTGDEIVRPGAPLGMGQVYDSNHYLLHALLAGTGAETVDIGILKDDPALVHVALERAAAEHHVILTTGGTSRGEEDHMVAALDALGSRHLWQLAIKPGRPMSFGQIGDCVFLGLPGNPVAAMVCFLLYVRPVLAAMVGAPWPEPTRYPIPASFEIGKKKPDRREFYRGILKRDEKGDLYVDKFSGDGSGLISSLRAADGLIEIPEEATKVERGSLVSFIPFTEFGLPAK